MRAILLIFVAASSSFFSGEAIAQSCYSFTGYTDNCWPSTQEDVYCTGECFPVSGVCKSGVNIQIQYDTTTTWDEVIYEPNEDTGYHAWDEYYVLCTYDADCICVPDSESSTGRACAADLTTETLDEYLIYFLDTDDPCFPLP
ncbi:hypothetical protein [Novipirellula rosea]|uniref:Uncharacterized protein n=1 Tax=Novipirellula rosea TaxID=1031540 RepID=A0ABP8NKE4_9BACT